MRTVKMKKILLGMLLITCGMLLSIEWAPKDGLTISVVKSAYARVGRPLTPGSVAGVNRRVHRRHYHYNNAYYNNGYYRNGYYYHY